MIPSIKEKFKEYLQDKRQIDNVKEDDNMLRFTVNNLNYIYLEDVEDPFYFRLLLPNIGSSSNDKMLEMANTLSLYFKVGKAVVVNNSIWLSAEQYIVEYTDIDMLFEKYLMILEKMIEKYRQDSEKGDENGKE